MGAFTSYAIYSSLYLLAGYLIYKWLMSGEKQMALNRVTLLMIYAIALIAMPCADILRGLFEPEVSAAAGVAIGAPAFVSAQASGHSSWARVVVFIYFAGVLLAAVWSMYSYLSIRRMLASGRVIGSRDGVRLILLPPGAAAPFSWLNHVAMTEDDYRAGGSVIIAHELAHVRHRHCLDLILAQLMCVFQWFNPASWLMREELKTVHEFQADDTVLRSGIAMRQYQLLLIKKAVGTRFQSLANSLNHSNLKKRITMMYNQKSSARRRLRALAIVPAIGAALAVCNIPAVAATISATSQVTAAAPSGAGASVGKVSEFSLAAKASAQAPATAPSAPADALPAYPGGEGAMFKFLIENVKYPEEAVAGNIQGVVAVKFVVEADGSITGTEVIKSVNPVLDKEAVRVVNSMPRWVPGRVDGKNAAITMTLPVSFKLTDDGKR